MRHRDPVARCLSDRKYHQRIVKSKRHQTRQERKRETDVHIRMARREESV